MLMKNFGKVTIWNCFGIISIGAVRILAKTEFGNVLEKF